ncbi:MAG: hypothetical protein GF311_21755 [Candidatus Lokiarchaeota archaeon]|nr:hypothetical protein [Candidatus Lokiarchaeota archaeon]
MGNIPALSQWYDRYPLRMEYNGDNPLFVEGRKHLNKNSKSFLSPVTNLTLNTISSISDNSNLIICIPSSRLKPLPIISYITAKNTDKSVLVFNRYKIHHKLYHLLKKERLFIWNDIPAGKIYKGNIKINPYTPYATRRFKDELKSKIPILREQFFNPALPKVLFNRKGKIEFTESISELFLNEENISSEAGESYLGIGNVIFENLDSNVYSDYTFDTFKEWINHYIDQGLRFICHISNPHYKYLESLKTHFNAYILYFPFSFLKTNKDFQEKNTYYFEKIKEKEDTNLFYVVDSLNLDNLSFYEKDADEFPKINTSLKQGNIDEYFNRGMRYINEINEHIIVEELKPLYYKIKQLYFKIYKTFCLPYEFNVRYFDDELGFRYFNLEYFFKIAKNEIENKSKELQKESLKNILLYLYKMMIELSQCKRFGEQKSYSRISKYYALLDFIANNSKEKIVIAVQQGEKSIISEKLSLLDVNGNVKVLTMNKLSRIMGKFSEYFLLLPGTLLPSQINILFKDWKNILYFAYEGKNQKWIEEQIQLIEKIDISKEEVSLKYLSEVYKEVFSDSNYKLEEDPIFKNFLEKKQKIRDAEQNRISENESFKVSDLKKKSNMFEEEVIASSGTIEDMCKKIMLKDIDKYKDTIEEEKIDSFIKNHEREREEKINEEKEHFECVINLKNITTEEKTQKNLDVDRTYMYFKDISEININYGFPYSLKKGDYLVLFGDNVKTSINDFIQETFGLEDEFDIIDYELIDEWHKRLANYFLNNYSYYKDFHRDFIKNTDSQISYNEFRHWIKGEVNYTKDPIDLYNLGKLMNDPFFIDNYIQINREGTKIQIYHQKITRRIKKIIKNILDRNISREDISFEERLLLEKIERCIYEILDLNIQR